jgi:hypothetical protein
MSSPTINILTDVLRSYLQGEYPELSHIELDTVAREVLDNLSKNEEFQDLYHQIITSTLEAYVATHPVEEQKPDEDEITAFKQKAKELGFKVSPMAPKVYLFDCICGASHTKVYCGFGGTMKDRVMRCHVCGLEGPPRKYQYQAKQAWNDMISSTLNERRKDDEL